MKKPNYLEMEEVLNTYWICRKQMQILMPQFAEKRLRIEFEAILKDMEENGEPYFNSRPVLIPVQKVVERYKLNTAYILKEAKRIRKELEKGEKNEKESIKS